jgi:hypothetical protein
MRMGVAGVVGVFCAVAVVAAIELVSHAIYAPPIPPDMNDPAAVAAFIGSMPLGAFLFVLGAYVAGTAVGGLVANAIARRHAMRFAWIVGGLILAASIANFLRLPHPAWFVVATLVAVPLTAWLTGRAGQASMAA